MIAAPLLFPNHRDQHRIQKEEVSRSRMGSYIYAKIQQVIQSSIAVIINRHRYISQIHHSIVDLKFDVTPCNRIECPAQIMPVDLCCDLVVAQRLMTSGDLTPITRQLHMMVFGWPGESAALHLR